MRLPKLTERKIFWIIAFFLFTNIAVLRYHTIHEPFERDITHYAYIGHQIIEGKTLYIDVWDNKPPGAPVVFAIFELLFGYNDTAIYALNVFFSASIMIFLGLIARELFGFVPSLPVMLLYVLVSQNPDTQANQPNTEIIVNCFKLLGVFLMLKAVASEGKRRILVTALSGLAVGISSSVKPITFFSFLALLAISAIYGQKRGIKGRLKTAAAFSAGAGWESPITSRITIRCTKRSAPTASIAMTAS